LLFNAKASYKIIKNSKLKTKINIKDKVLDQNKNVTNSYVFVLFFLLLLALLLFLVGSGLLPLRINV
jgi:hypothetical protein